jgi:hypothetical protein
MVAFALVVCATFAGVACASTESIGGGGGTAAIGGTAGPAVSATAEPAKGSQDTINDFFLLVGVLGLAYLFASYYTRRREADRDIIVAALKVVTQGNTKQAETLERANAQVAMALQFVSALPPTLIVPAPGHAPSIEAIKALKESVESLKGQTVRELEQAKKLLNALIEEARP